MNAKNSPQCIAIWNSKRFQRFIKRIDISASGDISFSINDSIDTQGLSGLPLLLVLVKHYKGLLDELQDEMTSLNIENLPQYMVQGYIREYSAYATLYRSFMDDIKILKEPHTEGKPTDQHFIPNAYTQFFTDNLTLKKKPNRLSKLSTKGKVSLISTNSPDFKWGSNEPIMLYSNSLESLFSCIEGDYAKVINQFIKKSSSTDLRLGRSWNFDEDSFNHSTKNAWDRMILSLFMVIQFTRSPSSVKQVEERGRKFGQESKADKMLVNTLTSFSTDLFLGQWTWAKTEDDLFFLSETVVFDRGYYSSQGTWNMPIGRKLMISVDYDSSKNCNTATNSNIVIQTQEETKTFKNLMYEQMLTKGLSAFGCPFDTPFSENKHFEMNLAETKEPIAIWKTDYPSM